MSKARWTRQDIVDQTGKIAVVTGANSGLGFETSRALAAKGADVILACRDEARGHAAARRIMTELPSAAVEVMVLDLSDLSSIQSFAARFAERSDKLHLLINNAGVMIPPYAKTTDGFELQFGTNHLGHFALTGLLLAKLLGVEGSRVVTVSSVVHRGGHIDFDDPSFENRPYRKRKAYAQSKLPNLLFTYELARRLESAGKSTIAAASHPGWTATELQKHIALATIFNPLLAQPPAQGALPTLYAATADDVSGGDYFGPDGILEWKGYPKRVKSHRRSHDEEVAKRLWQVSEELTQVPFGLP